MSLLDHINGPDDIKKLNINQLTELASDVRNALIYKLSNTGGHVGSNLGVVELTVALHYVFNSPEDKIIWDVSHQCYPHKILTGRKQAYTDCKHFNEVTGFTNTNESEHDHFIIGHSSTSISLALGMAKARDIAESDTAHAGKTQNIISIIGDGALSGGEAYEALNYAGEYDNNLIIIVNDNDQSIGENHGGLYKTLRALRESNGLCEHNFFKGLGLEYRYLDDGHDIIKLVHLFEEIKNINRPIVLHIHTIKGKGLPYAEANREEWHSHSPFFEETGIPKGGYPVYDTTIHDSLTELLERDRNSIIISAATPRAMGFVGEERDRLIQEGRFIDVGIAEENAMTISGGIAKYGSTAVLGAYAPFLQRAYDQIYHDVCLNDAPSTTLVLMPGAYGMKSNTHLGLCDIQMFSHMPNMIYLSPAYTEEYRQMLRYATMQKTHPVAIRVPNRFISSGDADNTDYTIINTAKIMSKGEGAAIIAVGTLIPKALEIAQEYYEKEHKKITVINPIFLSGLDCTLIDSLKTDHTLIITLEDGILEGGYGERIAAYLGTTDMSVITLGITKKFHSDFNADELLAECGISSANIINLIDRHLS